MGYIELPDGAPDTKKAVISVWFRVPGSSIAAAAGGGGALFGQSKTIPIVTLGPDTEIKEWKTTDGPPLPSISGQDYLISGIDGSITPQGAPYTEGGGTASIPAYTGGTHQGLPSFIGVDCSGDVPCLIANFVMPRDNAATMDGGQVFAITSSAGSSAPLGLYLGAIQNCIPVSGGPLAEAYTVFSSSEHSGAQVVLGATPETFRAGGWTPNDPVMAITPDHWHHLLLSFDFSNNVVVKGGFSTRNLELPCEPDGTCGAGGVSPPPDDGTVGSACKMYIALDDVNMTGKQLTTYRGKGSGPNEIITINAMAMYSDFGYSISDTGCIRFGRQQTITTEVATPTYSFRPDRVPFSDGPLGCPAAALYVSDIHHVEMAELQIFTGIAIDTANTGNRRAFITDKKKPAPMSAAKDLFGDPAIKLHGSSNWKHARNTGTFGAAPPSGPAVGDIQTYRPNPNLNDDQGKAQ